MSLNQVSEIKVSGGRLLRIEHDSKVCQGVNDFCNIFATTSKNRCLGG